MGDNFDGEPPINPEDLKREVDNLRRGYTFTKYTYKNKAQKLFVFDPLTNCWNWSAPPVGGKRGKIEGSVSIYEIREIRPENQHKDFERYSSEVSKDPACCFTVLYGNEFRLKSVSVSAENRATAQECIDGLARLVDFEFCCFPQQIRERWIRQTWRGMNPKDDTVSQSDVKKCIKSNGSKITGHVRAAIDKFSRKSMNLFDFRALYDRLFEIEEITKVFNQITGNQEHMTLPQFRQFLLQYQKEDRPREDLVFIMQIFDLKHTAQEEDFMKYMYDVYLADIADQTSNPNFSPRWDKYQFQHYVCSKINHVMNEEHVAEYQDMSQPLAHYFISSSHNTYLTGDQLQSESSTEAYIRCLRSGYRCLEIDTWDGRNNIPNVYHGHTLTSKIQFDDVVKVIADHAFERSTYPLILSLEDHCCVDQQKKMAEIFKTYFKESLQTTVLDMDSPHMPSPKDLEGKIILKHKKIKPGELGGDIMIHNHANTDDRVDADMSGAVKQGLLYLETTNHLFEKSFSRYYFCLRPDELMWLETPEEEEEEEEEEVEEHADFPSLNAGREEAARLLKNFPNVQNGVFLVRASSTYSNEFVFTLWYRNRPEHVRIRYNPNTCRFFLAKDEEFDSIRDLVQHCRTHPLNKIGIPFCLGEDVPLPENFNHEPWWNGKVNKVEAERMLKMVRKDGAFLLRNSDRDEKAIAISFWAGSSVKHCRIVVKQSGYAFGTNSFHTLTELVMFLKKNALYRKVKLQLPVNAEVVKNLPSQANSTGDAVEDDIYFDSATSPSGMFDQGTYKALHEFKPGTMYRDALTFNKGAIIHNVEETDDDWWRGEYAGQTGYFPANYVIKIQQPRVEDNNKKLNMEKGSVKITKDCKIELIATPHLERFKTCLKIHSEDGRDFVLASEDIAELQKWCVEVLKQTEDAQNLYQDAKSLSVAQQISHHLSDLIGYCQTNKFNSFDHSRENGKHYEMSSFPENKAMALSKKYPADFTEYNKKQFSRIYPQGKRVDSSNFDPIPLWNVGCQLVALNCQTDDRPMQINKGRFRQNGDIGYVLKPKVMTEPNNGFNCNAPLTFKARVKKIAIKILGARHLTRSKGMPSPFVSIEVVGVRSDSSDQGGRSKTKASNGFCPQWTGDDTFEVKMDIKMPELAMIRFLVEDEDMFGDPNFIGQYVLPVTSLMTGYRYIPLENSFGESLRNSCLLAKIDVVELSSEQSDKIYEDVEKDEIIRIRIQVLEAEIEDHRVRIQELMESPDRINFQDEIVKIEEQIKLKLADKENLEKNMLAMDRMNQQRQSLRNRQQY